MGITRSKVILFFLVSLRASKKFLNKLLQFCSIFWKCLYISLCFQLCFMCFWYIWRTFVFWWEKILAPTGTYRFGGAFGTRACILFWFILVGHCTGTIAEHVCLANFLTKFLFACRGHWFQLRAFIEHVFKSTAFEEFGEKTSVLGLRAERWFFPLTQLWILKGGFTVQRSKFSGGSMRGKIIVVYFC